MHYIYLKFQLISHVLNQQGTGYKCLIEKMCLVLRRASKLVRLPNVCLVFLVQTQFDDVIHFWEALLQRALYGSEGPDIDETKLSSRQI